MSEVRLAEVTRTFGDTVAVDELSITVRNGEFLVLLGPTGAGKTTTLRLVSGLEKPDQGTIHIGGADHTRTAPAERDVAFVFQQYSLYPHYSVYDNLAFPLRSPRRRVPEPEIKSRVQEVATMLRIDAKLKNRATQLSGGEMQRVAIGRALVRRPAVFLMDEPLSSLDAKLREGLRVELKRIQSDLAATMFYVTHDQVEAMTMADRIGILHEGRLVQIGPPREIYERPNSLYVARRLGAHPINDMPVESLETQSPAEAVRVGIRPENVVLGAGTATADVLAVEPLGAETIVRLQGERGSFYALTSSGPEIRVGDRVPYRFDMETALYFSDTGRRVERLSAEAAQ